MLPSYGLQCKGSLHSPKRMNFRKFQTAFDPLSLFRNKLLWIFRKKDGSLSPDFPIWSGKFCNIFFGIGNDPPPFWNFSENESVLESESFRKTMMVLAAGEGYGVNTASYCYGYHPTAAALPPRLIISIDGQSASYWAAPWRAGGLLLPPFQITSKTALHKQFRFVPYVHGYGICSALTHVHW